MKMNALAWGISVLILVQPALADKLILKNGDVISGRYTKEGDTVTIITVEGRTRVFDVSEIKRKVYESRVTLDEAADMLSELMDLAEPAIAESEPVEYRWFKDVRRTSSEWNRSSSSREIQGRVYQERYGPGWRSGSSMSARRKESSAHGSSTSESVSETLRDTEIDEVFVDEWMRYADGFARLKKNKRYRTLIGTRTRSNTLGEFASHPPEGFEAEALAIRTALTSLRNCVELAGRTTRMVEGIPKKQGAHDHRIRELERSLKNARNKIATVKNKSAQKKKIARISNDLYSRKNRMEKEKVEKQRATKAKISDFASLRIETKTQFVAAADLLETARVDEMERPTDFEEPHAYNLAEAIDTSLDAILVHRKNSEGLTSEGLRQLRIDTEAQILDDFAGKRFYMVLFIDDITSAGNGNYVLTAGDHPMGDGDTRARVNLEFGPRRHGELGAQVCKRDATIGVVAKILKVEIIPPLSVLEDNRSSIPTFALAGDLLAVERGCGPK